MSHPPIPADGLHIGAGIAFDRPNSEAGPNGEPVRARIVTFNPDTPEDQQVALVVWYSDVDAARVCSQLLKAMRPARMPEHDPRADLLDTYGKPPMISGEPTPPVERKETP